MRVRLIRALRFSCLAGLTLGGILAFAFPATAQWQAPPWRFAWPPGEIEWNLNAQGYVLTAPLMRRPGIYLADVSAGPGGYQRLIIDARSGRILERFPAPGRIWATRARLPGRRVRRSSALRDGRATERGILRRASTRAGGETGPRRGGHPYSGGHQPVRRRGRSGQRRAQAKVRFDHTQASGDQAGRADHQPASSPSRSTRNSESGWIGRGRSRLVRRGARQTESEHRPSGAVRVDKKRAPRLGRSDFPALARCFTQPARRAP